MAGLLESEGLHAPDEGEMGVARIELGQAATRAVAQVAGVAQEEVELVPEGQGQQVGGPARQQGVERP